MRWLRLPKRVPRAVEAAMARGGDHARQGPQHTGGQNPTPDERSCQRGQPGKQEQAQPGFLTGSS